MYRGYFRYDKYHGLNVECPPQGHLFEYLVSSWWCYLGCGTFRRWSLAAESRP